jgi:TnpA family transposase
VPDLERVAVDTHGFTHFAMALAKLVGFDLCPRLARLKTRKLYLTRSIEVPPVLQPIVAETVSRRAISRAWDSLLRLASSVREGWCPATEALERFGSAARGDPVHSAGEALGKLLRTVYLCDYLGNPSFRREILDLLNQGEAVHSLQRAIQQGPIGARRGRTIEQLAAISGALTLLANLVMAWNTHRMQAIIGRSPAHHPDELVARIAPTMHQHINMRGILTFNLGRHRPRLLTDLPIRPARARTG